MVTHILLDEREAAEAKRRAEQKLNTVTIPALRVFGFAVLTLAVFFYNDLFSHEFPQKDILGFTGIILAYCLLTWVLLATLWGRFGRVDLGLFVQMTDILIFLLMIYYSGGERSFLFLVLLVRSVDLPRPRFAKSILAGQAAILGYVLLLVYLHLWERRSLNWTAEGIKVFVLVGTGFYYAMMTRTGEIARKRASAAIRVARESLRRMDEEIRQRKESEEVYRSIVESAPCAMVMVDQQGRVALASALTEDLFGYRPDELIGMAIESLMPARYRDQHQRDRSSFVMAGRARTMGQGLHIYGLARSGEEIPLEIGLSQMKIGQRTFILAAIMGVTKLEKAERALKESESKFKALAEKIPAVVYLAEFGYPGPWHYVSPQIEGLLGFTQDEWVSDPGLYWKQMHPEDRDRVMAHEVEVQGMGKLFSIDYRIFSRSGKMIWVHDEGTDLMKENLYQGFIVDITERMQIEQLRRELISVVSHELRTPLASIHASLGLLAGNVAGEMPVLMKDLVTTARSGSERLTLLLNDLLDMEKIASNKMVFESKPYSMHELVREAIRSNEVYAREHETPVHLETSSNGALVLVDRDRFQQVMTNLLSNAIKFSPRGMTVLVALATADSGFLRVSVTDHGPGIPEEFRSRIFERFAQADSSDTRRRGGTGLGLSIAKALTERMNGSIGFQSVVGEGTTFYVEFPIEPIVSESTAARKD